MDPLLSMLETSKVGLSVNGCYAGGFAHADDIRTLSSSSDTLSSQVEMVGRFASEMHLKLNFSKCEVVQSARQRGQVACKVEIDGVEIPREKEGKCLGYWWQGDLFAKKAVEENVMKAIGGLSL